MLFEAKYNGAHTAQCGIVGVEWTGVKGHQSLLSLTDHRIHFHRTKPTRILTIFMKHFHDVMSWGLHFQNSHWFWWAALLLIRAKKDFQRDFVWTFLHHPQQDEGDALQLHAWYDILLSILSGDMVWTWNICAVRYWDLILHFGQNHRYGPFNAQMSILHTFMRTTFTWLHVRMIMWIYMNSSWFLLPTFHLNF